MSSAPPCPPAGLPTRHRAAAVVVGLVAALFILQTGMIPRAVAADVAPRMYQGQAFPTAGSSPTEDKPQSKLWFADGSWWALMRTTTNGSDRTPDVTVHQLQDDHTWRDTGALVDRRSGSTGDALWEGGKLYVASRSTSGAVQVGRLSFDPVTDSYAMDAGFPVVVGSGSVESVTIARDSLRRLWVTYTEPDPVDATLDRVIVAHSTTDDTTWTAPFAVPVPDSTVKADDISAIVAFSGKVGVMWSDQQNEVVRFAVHPDTAADDSGWTMETALDGTRSADDHLNLKSLLEDDAGRVYAAVKTSRGDDSTDSPEDAGIRVLTRSATGGWTAATAAAVGDGLTRPQLALDATNRELYVVMSTESGGNVYYKKSPLGASLSFPAGTPGETLLTWSGALINDATTAKAPITAESGLVVLASDDKNTKRYYHAELDLDVAPADSMAPSVPSGVTAVADSASQATVRWTASTDAVGVASYRVLRNGAAVAEAVTATSFVDTAVAPGGTYSYTVSAVDAAGNRSGESEPAVVRVSGVLVRGSTQAGSTVTSRTVSLARPAGLAAGDVLVAQINADDAPTMGAVPAGWTAALEPLSMGTNARMFVYYRVVTDVAAEPASYVWQLATAEKWNALLTAFGGVDAANPFDTPASTAVTAVAGRMLTVPGVSTGTPGALLVGGVAANNAKLSVTEPTGFTELVEARGAQVTELAAQARPAPGATGPATWRLSASYTAAGWLRALRPAGPSDGGTGSPDPAVPTASFTAAPTSGTAPLTVQFTDTSTGGPTSWAWDFGDGSTSTAQNPGHVYASAGSYPVTLTATNASGSSTSAPRTITVATPAPTGGIAVGASSQAGSTSSTTTVTVPRPGDVAAGDVLIAQINADDAPSVSVVPEGWSAVLEPLSVGTSARSFVYWRTVTDAEPASYAWQLSAAAKWNAAVTAFRGVDTAVPFDTPASAVATTTKAGTLTVPGVVTATPGAVLVGGVGPNNATLSVTPPAGWVETMESRGAQVAELATQARPSAGATGDATWRFSAAYGSTGWLRALRPAG